MPVIGINTSFDVPGVYVTEDTYGAVPNSLASYNSVYMIGYGSNPSAPASVPTYITSPDDFFNTFGTSASAASVELFFAQRSGVGLWFIHVPTKERYTITVPTATVGAAYTLTLDGYAVTYTAVAGDTPASIITGLTKAVNTQAIHIAYIQSANLLVNPSLTVSASANITLGAKIAAPGYPTAMDAIATINKAFDPGMRQGFLLAPEFFQSFTQQTDRVALAGAMDALCSDPKYNWSALIDCGQSVATQTTAAGAVNLAIAERNLLSSPRGHSAYFFPYWSNVTGALVPMSASVAGVALRRYRDQGYRQPPAGIRYPVYGVVDTSYPITDKVQAVLNPIGVNCGRRLPAGKGTVIYGARTLSTSPYYRFIPTRVVLNVLEGTLLRSFDDLIFTSIDGQGELFGRVKATASGICETLRQGGALFGGTPEEAYLVICDKSNNPPNALEAGDVFVDVIVKPSPTLEALVVRVSRASLGTNLSEIAGSGDKSDIQDVSKSSTSGGKPIA